MSKKNTNTVETRKVKYLCSINDDTLSEDTDPDLEIRYIDIGNVDSTGKIETIANYKFSEAPSRARRIVRKGDIIVSTVRTYLQAITLIDFESENLIVSTGFAVIRPIENIYLPKFCGYVVRNLAFISEVQRRSVGVSYPAINASDLGDILVPVPSIERQKEIANYLNKEISYIDSVTDAKQIQLQILSEKRQALIKQAVTKGINPTVKLKDSGIEWIGKIPKHWKIERSKWLFSERNQRSQSGEEELLTVSHITGVTPRAEKDVNMFEAETTEGYKIVFKNDLVINTLWAWMGAMGISPKDGIASPAYHVYEPLERIEPMYVDAIVRLPIFANEVIRYSKGVWSSRLRLYPDGFYEVFLPVPPLEEQKQIVDYIKSELSKIVEMSEASSRSIKLLEERRSALITAAVTGQIEIPA